MCDCDKLNIVFFFSTDYLFYLFPRELDKSSGVLYPDDTPFPRWREMMECRYHFLKLAEDSSPRRHALPVPAVSGLPHPPVLVLSF